MGEASGCAHLVYRVTVLHPAGVHLSQQKCTLFSGVHPGDAGYSQTSCTRDTSTWSCAVPGPTGIKSNVPKLQTRRSVTLSETNTDTQLRVGLQTQRLCKLTHRPRDQPVRDTQSERLHLNAFSLFGPKGGECDTLDDAIFLSGQTTFVGNRLAITPRKSATLS